MVTNALVIDVEYWHSPELLRGYSGVKTPDQIRESLDPIIELLDKHGVRATFAFLGKVCEDHPELPKDVYERGHEIASHAWSHKMLSDLGKDAFRNEIEKSKRLIRSATGELPVGFRAPSFSMNESTKWALDVLADSGFIYDASIFPIKTALYGVSNAPMGIYRPSKSDITQHDPNGKIIEFPMTVMEYYTRIPISGGFYLRALPFRFLKFGIKKVNEERPAIIYFHPWEIYEGTPKLKIPLYESFITYYNIKSTMSKLESLIKAFKFSSIIDVLNNI